MKLLTKHKGDIKYWVFVVGLVTAWAVVNILSGGDAFTIITRALLLLMIALCWRVLMKATNIA